ncbi:uncharacterized protein LOC105188782 [Harpegnathos saltator]|uniref:uncharacterized protein LOC105188782 n=1 Tax=Harpegnathos saltator TaxID=610380 RepID=UPI00058C82E6|nr:uncharacterized protein LOC105188782 [Harpegnathos saltator]
MQSSSNNKDANNKAADKTAPSTEDKKNKEKKRLLKEIQELRCIIEQSEWSMEMLRFKDAEHLIKPPQNSNISHLGRVPNVEVQLQNDLYKFAGLHCAKFRRSEVVFNFSSTDEHQKDNAYAVQILVKDGKSSLGKWVMPMSIDMNQILTKIPIDKPSNLTAFAKYCKHNINCYTTRQQQFLSLKEHTLHMKHCALYSNIGYMQINIELYGIHDKDEYIDLMVYLLYHSDEARPYQIKIDTTSKKELSDEIKQKWKTYLKEFKISDLRTAFDKIFVKKNPTYTWTPGDDSESPLEINDTSNSDEDFLEQLQSKQRYSLRVRKKRKIWNKWSAKKKQKNMENSTSSKDISDNAHSRAEESRSESPHQTPVNKKETRKKVSSLSLKQQKQIDKNLLEATPIKEPKIILKQIKLNFQATQSMNSDKINKVLSSQSKPHIKLGRKNKKVAKLITSTPLSRRVNPKVVLSTLEIDNITEIGSPSEKEVDNLNSSRNSSRLKNKNSPKENIQNTLRKSPRSAKLSLNTHTVKGVKSKTKNMKN